MSDDDRSDPAAESRNLRELTIYADTNGWRLVEDVALPPSEWLGGPTGLPGWRFIYVKGDHAIGYEWFGFTSRESACRRVLRALRKWDAPDP